MSVRVGILGTGSAAELYHMPGYRENPEVQVVACADQDVERARRFAKKYAIENVYADYHEMFDKARLDIVSICTPNYSTEYFNRLTSAKRSSEHKAQN